MYAKYAELRDKKGVRDADVARAINVSQAMFSEWKKDKYQPKVDKIIAIAEYFQVPLDVFIRKEDV